MSEFTIRESQLCGELGISKDELRRRRVFWLSEGKHWGYVAKRVMLSERGAVILRRTAGDSLVPGPEKNAAAADSVRKTAPVALLAEKNAPRVAFDGELVVWATPGLNRRMVVGYVPGDDPSNPLNLVSVLVRDNGNFIRGMKLPGPGGVLRRTGEVTFDLDGPCPRGRGRW